MNRRAVSMLGALFLVALGALPSYAQNCPGDDNFGWPLGCCTPATGNFPVFPAITINGLQACLRDCGVESQATQTTTIVPSQVLCDYWIMNMAILAGSHVVATPVVVAKYSRTWLEFAGPNTTLQVWRFLVNGDFNYTGITAALSGCPVPLSAFPPFSLPVHYMGHVDYARDCNTGAWSLAYSLSHFCPDEMHAPFSARPIPAASGWVKRTYHFVAPANFVFGACAPPSGPLLGDASRTSVGLTNPSVPYTCLREKQINQAFLGNVNTTCECWTPMGVVVPQIYTHQNLMSFDTCAGAGAPIISFGGFNLPFMPTGLRAMTLGSWVTSTGVGPYPGNECLSVYLGIIEGPDICSPLVQPPLNAAAGVGTTGGFPSQVPNVPIGAPGGFVDLCNILVLTTAGFNPGLGALYASERLWSWNTP